jgi:hypothetical protein
MKKKAWLLFSSAILLGYFSIVSCTKSDNKDTSPVVGEWMAVQFKGNSTNYTTTPPTVTPVDEHYTPEQTIYLKFNNDNTYDTRTYDTTGYDPTGTYALINNNTKIIFSLTDNSMTDTVDITFNGNLFSMSSFREETTDKFDNNGQKIGTTLVSRDEGILTMKKL